MALGTKSHQNMPQKLNHSVFVFWLFCSKQLIKLVVSRYMQELLSLGANIREEGCICSLMRASDCFSSAEEDGLMSCHRHQLIVFERRHVSLSRVRRWGEISFSSKLLSIKPVNYFCVTGSLFLAWDSEWSCLWGSFGLIYHLVLLCFKDASCFFTDNAIIHTNYNLDWWRAICVMCDLDVVCTFNPSCKIFYKTGDRAAETFLCKTSLWLQRCRVLTKQYFGSLVVITLCASWSVKLTLMASVTLASVDLHFKTLLRPRVLLSHWWATNISHFPTCAQPLTQPLGWLAARAS